LKHKKWSKAESEEEEEEEEEGKVRNETKMGKCLEFDGKFQTQTENGKRLWVAFTARGSRHR
jgi:hypothetical protein